MKGKKNVRAGINRRAGEQLDWEETRLSDGTGCKYTVEKD